MRKLLICLSIIILTACVKESRIEIPYAGDKIVVNSLIQPDSLIYIRVTGSKKVTEYSFDPLDSATVVLQENGITLPTPTYQLINGYGYFVSQSVAKTGSHYAIQVANKGLTAVSGSDSTPMRAHISNAYAQRGLNRVRFTLQEDGSTINYYRLRIFTAVESNGNWVIDKTDTIHFRLDPALNNDLPDIITNDYKSESIMTDENFNGKTIQFVLQTKKEVSSSHMIIELSALTPAAWKYFQSTYTQRLNDSQDFSLDPENAYSNVENGYGIIAGVNAARLLFTVE
ncbi:DUF4249 domain-containing protein [Chitinophaga silvisoli]|uniref:DUF4249 domain-containing protein n=1 Tax=Chitinophaga silvisoli TaxID=2291814 RepID=A0A3E1P2X8_9BACT|nr:DUF4249 domain-containing protein [Chitinophaga silvisoli]RFM34556.1 DUF4249 domain-containing protein [Chitinophaga silvisoli]